MSDTHPDRSDRSVHRRFVPHALVAVLLAGGAGAYAAADKTVTLTVDGRPRTLHTFARTVGEALRREGITVGPHDIVAPAAGRPLHDGDAVVVRYGRLLSLTLDGERRQVWTTGRTVAEALRQLGVRADGAYVSASREAAIGRRGQALDVRTARTVTIRADGRYRTVRTTAATVAEALAAAGLALAGQDTVSADPGSFPYDGQALTVHRISVTREVRAERVGYRTLRRADPRLPRGTRAVDAPGRAGVRQVTYAVRRVDGVQRGARVTASRITRAPVARVVRVGTGSGSGSGSRSRPPQDRLDWRALARCEAGGRPGAVDPSGTYGGLYQFDVRTWRSTGGRGRPQDAPAAEQTYRAKKLYARRGAAPWPVCGRHLRP